MGPVCLIVAPRGVSMLVCVRVMTLQERVMTLQERAMTLQERVMTLMRES